MSFSKIYHMIFPNPKGKLQTLKQLRFSGKIKIHQHSPVITLLLGEWMTDWPTDWRANVRYSNPATKRKQPFTRKHHSRWLYESTLPESLVFPFFWPGTSTIGIQVPNRTHTVVCSPPHKWQITSGLIIKNQCSPEGVVVERGGGGRKRIWGAKQSLLSIRR